jgi:DNA polymerase-1
MNWQNSPAHDERSQRFRECVGAKLDALLAADYQGMEWRIFAYYCAAQPTIADYSLVKEILRGEDPYTNTGKLVLGRDPTKEERGTYKRAALSMLYNGDWPTILKQGLATSDSEAKDIVQEIHGARPQIAKLKKCVERVMKDRGYITTLWGRQSAGRTHNLKTGRFIKPERRPMVNYLIQGSASDIMKDAILNIADFLDKGLYVSHNVLTIHDEILLDCVEDEIPGIVQNLQPLMTNARVEEYVPLGIDIAIARGSWADEVPLEVYEAPRNLSMLSEEESDLPWD